LLACLRVAADFRRGKPVEGFVIGGVDGDELALKMGREFGHLDAVVACLACELVAIGFGLSGFFQVDQASVPARHLHALVTAIGGPFGDLFPGIERGGIAGELCKKERGALDGLHLSSPPSKGGPL
jgi:hypothetical protein